MLTLVQTRKLARDIPVILYGPAYWREILNFDALVRHGMISAQDLKLIQFADTPAEALQLLQTGLHDEPAAASPAIAHSRAAPWQGPADG